MPTISPTHEARQRMAFALLRDQARSAHLLGDGLRVSTLVETAAQQLEHLLSKDRLLLKVSEVHWIVVLRLYWLVTNYSCWSTELLLTKLKPSDPSDEALLNCLRVYQHLVADPLNGKSALERLQAIDITSLGDEGEVEARELVRHFVELAWFRSPGTSHWRQLLTGWQSKSGWIKNALEGIEKRLSVQTRLTAPSANSPLFSISNLQELRAASPLAELWALHVLGEKKRLLDALTVLDSSTSGTSAEWRTIADYWHTNDGAHQTSSDSPIANSEIALVDLSDSNGVIEKQNARQIGGASRDKVVHDSIDVWLARRRFMSADSPFVRFCDYREACIDECSHKLFRQRDKGNASLRREIWQLAMLHELVALRMWDFGVWRAATKAQGESLLEACHWQGDRTSNVAFGLSLIIHSLAVKDPAKDWLLKSIIESLEFSELSTRAQVVEACFHSYPREHYQVSDLLEHLSDFVPEECLEGLAEWTVRWTESCSYNKTGGWKLNRLKHWRQLLPIVGSDSRIWTLLQKEVQRLATYTHGWRGGDEKAIIRGWLVWAPRCQMAELVEQLTSAEVGDYGDRVALAELAIEVEKYRPEIIPLFSQRLRSKATDNVELSILGGRLAEDSASQSILKKRVKAGICAAMEKAAPVDPLAGFSFGPFPAGIDQIMQWEVEDAPLVTQLIETIDSEHVHREWLWWLFNTLQLIAANGSTELTALVIPAVERWSLKMPAGRSFTSGMSGPWSAVQSSDTEDGELMLCLGWLAFQTLRKCGDRGIAAFLAWSERTLETGHAKGLSIGFYGAVLAAARANGPTFQHALLIVDACLVVLSAGLDKSESDHALGDALRHLSSIVRQQKTEIVDWSQPSPQLVLERILGHLNRSASRIGRSKSMKVRSGLALLLWRLRSWSDLSDSLTTIWQSLCADSRASVRMAAKGGWEDEAKRRYVRDER